MHNWLKLFLKRAQAVDSFSIDDIYILVLLLFLHLITRQKILNMFNLDIFNAPISLKRGLDNLAP